MGVLNFYEGIAIWSLVGRSPPRSVNLWRLPNTRTEGQLAGVFADYYTEGRPLQDIYCGYSLLSFREFAFALM